MAKTMILGLACCLPLLAGCGTAGSSSTNATAANPAGANTTAANPAGGDQATTNLYLEANPGGELRYNKSSLTARAGRVTIHFTNNSPMLHDVVVQSGANGPTLGATPAFIGGTRTLTLNLKPGRYTYYCSVPGHRAAGMLGTLTVQ